MIKLLMMNNLNNLKIKNNYKMIFMIHKKIFIK